MEPIEKIYSTICEGGKSIAITFHQKPDADAMGSALGLWHYLKLQGNFCTVISPTNWAPYLNWMPGCLSILDFEAKTAEANEILGSCDMVFCLDFNTLSRTKKMAAELAKLEVPLILIDHHQEPQISAFAYGISNSGKSSTAEMVYDFINDSGGASQINHDIATCLYAGVMTDTGSFRFPSTTASVHSMVADLKGKGLDHHLVHDNLFDTYLENRLRFTGHVLLNRLEVIYEMNTALIWVPKQDLQKFNIQTGDTEGLVNFPLSIQGIKLAAICIDRDEERKWSFRSKGDVDVNQFARKHFEGGGHKNAAGGRSSASLEDTVAYFKKAIEDLRDQLAEY